MKRLISSIFFLLASLAPTFGSGTIPFSLSQQFDSLGKPLANCFFFTIVAGTTSTPQSAFQDSALTLALPNPMRCDASGRLPQFYLADGLIKIRITDKNGVAQAYPNGANGIDNIQVIGPSGGGGGGGAVDPTTILATGDMKIVYGTGVLTGFVRANGRTIGSATSGATERANADAQALFQYLWGADANLAVSGGRGASAAADWAANKTLTLPDLRGRTIAGLDDMGNSAAGRLTSAATGFGTSPIVLGAASTATESKTLTTPNLPPYTPAGANASSAVTGGTTAAVAIIGGSNPGLTGSAAVGVTQASVNIAGTAAAQAWGGTPQGGTSTPFSIVQPTMVATYYIKL